MENSRWVRNVAVPACVRAVRVSRRRQHRDVSRIKVTDTRHTDPPIQSCLSSLHVRSSAVAGVCDVTRDAADNRDALQSAAVK